MVPIGQTFPNIKTSSFPKVIPPPAMIRREIDLQL